MHVNRMDVKFPHQLFINGQFLDSESGMMIGYDENDDKEME